MNPIWSPLTPPLHPQCQVWVLKNRFHVFSSPFLSLTSGVWSCHFVFMPKKSVCSVLSLTSPLSSSVAVNVPLPSVPVFGQYLITFQPLCAFNDHLFFLLLLWKLFCVFEIESYSLAQVVFFLLLGLQIWTTTSGQGSLIDSITGSCFFFF